MEDFQKVQIDALLRPRQETTEQDLESGRQVHARALRILEPLPYTGDTQIIWGSDDDRTVRIKRKRIIYNFEDGSQELALTNFHNNELDKALAVEIPDAHGRYSSIEPEFLFTITPDGVVNSPLGLIRPELAGAILELFEEVPKVDSVKVA